MGRRTGPKGRRSKTLTYPPRAAGGLEFPTVPGRGHQPGADGWPVLSALSHIRRGCQHQHQRKHASCVCRPSAGLWAP